MSSNLNRPWIRSLCSQPKPLGGCTKTVSAFRVLSTENQPIEGATVTQVLFQQVELDLGCEYDTETSTFTPKQSGVYSIFASILFRSNTFEQSTVIIEVIVNGVPTLSDDEYFPFGSGIVDTGGILPLKAGDKVQVTAFIAGLPGQILSDIGTRFDGAKIY